MTLPAFSIVIPFKTGKKYLMECVQSVLNQHYGNYEIIILADNTSNADGALDAVKALNEEKIRIDHSGSTLNILENWSRIKMISRKEYMTILGYDDLLEPDFLNVIAQLVTSEPAASLYHTHFNYIDATGKVIKPCLPLPEKLTANEYLSMALQNKVSIMATGYVFRSEDYDAVGGIPVQYPNLIYADLHLWIELIRRSYLSVSPGIHFSFRIHPSTTKTSKDLVLLKAFVIMLQYLQALQKEDPEIRKIIQAFAPVFIHDTTRSLAHRLLRTGKPYRDGLTMKTITEQIGKEADSMGFEYIPSSIPTMKMAMLIDSNPILHGLFLLFKKLYKKPVY